MNIPYIPLISDNLSRLLFFDIETTGLSAASSSLYLIGYIRVLEASDCTAEGTAVTHNQKTLSLELTQLFCENLNDEKEVLKCFAEVCGNYNTLIHFNGDGFDIPYINSCARQYSMPDFLSDMQSIDIYKLIRPYRQLLKSERMNQKSLEGFLDIQRDDIFSGGELIYVYEQFLKCGHEELLKLLLLHNEEDMTGMVSLISLLCYPAMLDSDFTVSDSCNTSDCITGIPLSDRSASLYSEEFAELRFSSEISVPVPVSYEINGIEIFIENNILNLKIPVFRGELKHYFANYKDYYYLTDEDIAVHKSIGEFVDKSRRKKAGREEACVKKTSSFLPVFRETGSPVFKREYKDKTEYIELPEFENIDKTWYLKALLSNVGLRRA